MDAIFAKKWTLKAKGKCFYVRIPKVISWEKHSQSCSIAKQNLWLGVIGNIFSFQFKKLSHKQSYS